MFSVVRLFSLFLTLFFGSKSLLVVYPQVGRAGVKPHFWKEQYLHILFGILLKERFQCLSVLFIFNFFKVIFFFFFALLGLHCSARVSLVVVEAQLPVACGLLVSQPGAEFMSPALEGRFLTTGPPGKSPPSHF